MLDKFFEMRCFNLTCKKILFRYMPGPVGDDVPRFCMLAGFIGI